MTRMFTVAVVLGALALGGPAVVAPSPITGTAQAAAACKKAKIGGQSKCVAAGQFCAKKHEADYRRYGFTCNQRDRNGRWHLRRR